MKKKNKCSSCSGKGSLPSPPAYPPRSSQYLHRIECVDCAGTGMSMTPDELKELQDSNGLKKVVNSLLSVEVPNFNDPRIGDNVKSMIRQLADTLKWVSR